MKNFLARLPLFILALLCLTFSCVTSAHAQSIVNNTPYNFNVSQSAQESGQVVVNTNSSSLYGAVYYVDFYNANGDMIGSDSVAPYGYNQEATFKLPCPSMQKSRNVARGVVRATYGNLQVNSAQANKTSDSEPKNLGSTDPVMAPLVGSKATISGGGLDAAAPPDEEWVYWRVHMEKEQRLSLKGWAESASTLYGVRCGL